MSTPKNKGTPVVHKDTPFPKSSGKANKSLNKTQETVEEEDVDSHFKKMQKKSPGPENKQAKSPSKNLKKQGQKPTENPEKIQTSTGDVSTPSMPEKRKQKQKSGKGKKAKLDKEESFLQTENLEKQKQKRSKNIQTIPKDLLHMDKVIFCKR